MTQKFSIYRVQLPLREPIMTGHGDINYRPTILLQYWLDGIEFWSELPAFMHSGYMAETHDTSWDMLCDIGHDIALAFLNQSFGEVIKKFPTLPLLRYALDGIYCQFQAHQQGKSLMESFGICPRDIGGSAMVGMQAQLSDLELNVNRICDAGYRGIKFKMTPLSLPMLLPVLKQSLIAFDHVVVDANGTFDDSNMDQLHDIPAEVVIEQPTQDVQLLKQYCDLLPNDILLDESIRSLADIDLALDLGVGVMIKPVCIGGLRHTIQMIEQCSKRNVPCGLSGYLDSGVGRYFQWVLAQHPLLNLAPDFVWSDYYFTDDVLVVAPGADYCHPLPVDYGRFCVASETFLIDQ